MEYTYSVGIRGDESEAELPFSSQLEAWLSHVGSKTIGDLGRVFGERSFAVTILFLMFIPALPLPTGGISHLFELITILLALEMIGGATTIWLPRFLNDRPLGVGLVTKALPFMIRRIQWFEKFARPRGTHLLARRSAARLLGLALAFLAGAAALAPPFSGLDTLPGMGAVAICLGIILGDLAIVGLGFVLGAAGVLLIVTIGATLIHFVPRLF